MGRVIHTCHEKKKEKDINKKCCENDEIKLSQRFSDGLSDPKSGPRAYLNERNPYGFMIRATNNGSMTQDSFYDWCLHFVKHLPEEDKEDGINTKPHILILDGHMSRWNREALKLLMENNVFPFFLPSHTSVWTQPNNCGTNKRFHVCVERAIKDMRRSSSKYDVTFFNIVIRTAWEMFMDMENKDLVACRANSTTSAWKHVGIYPFCPNSESWNNVISTLGELNEKMRTNDKGEVKELEKDYKVEVREDRDRGTLTSTETNIIASDLQEGTSILEAAYYHVRQMMGQWRDTRSPSFRVL